MLVKITIESPLNHHVGFLGFVLSIESAFNLHFWWNISLITIFNGNTISTKITMKSLFIAINHLLVGGFKHFLFSHSVGNVIIPTDFNSIIFQRLYPLNHHEIPIYSLEITEFLRVKSREITEFLLKSSPGRLHPVRRLLCPAAPRSRRRGRSRGLRPALAADGAGDVCDLVTLKNPLRWAMELGKTS